MTTVASGLTFRVRGRPVPQGSMRLVPTEKGPRITHHSDRLMSWRRTIAVTARAAGVREGSGPFGVDLAFYLPEDLARPLTGPPDLDKLIRAVLDALRGIAWSDDAQVVVLAARKQSATPTEAAGVTVTLVAVSA